MHVERQKDKKYGALNEDNFKTSYYDPYIKNIITEKKLKFQSIKLNPRVLKSFNLVILMTDHEIFNYKMIYKNSNQIIDCRGRYNLDKKIIRA